MILFHERILKISGFLQKLLDMTGEFGYNKSVGEFCKKFPKKAGNEIAANYQEVVPMALTNNKNVLQWVDEMVALTKPAKVVWIDGSKEQLDALTEEVTSLPEGNHDKMYKLNPDKLPGCLYHRTLPNDVARVEGSYLYLL